MRVAVTGTPGTGKTTATDELSTPLDVVHLNDVIKREGLTTGRDDQRETLVADVDALSDRLAEYDDVLFESHLAHLFDADRVVVLRAHPETIESRLSERGESAQSVTENAESEALDIVLTEAVDRHGEDSVYEIDTTDETPSAVAAAIEAVIDGERDPSAGTVSFLDYL
jgi:adenylate kinase